MGKKSNKIPGAAVAIVIVLLAGIIFVPAVYMPYKNKKPEMDAKHAAAVEEINMYEDAIANQASIEKNIAQLQAEWDEFYKEMFIDASSSLNEIEAKIRETDFFIQSFKKDDGQKDPEGAVSFTGAPLYYQQITIDGYSDEETLIEVLKAIEEESVGCYYVKTLTADTLDKEVEIGEHHTAKEGDLKVNMVIYLYYYNESERVEVPATDAAAATDTV